MFSKLIIALDFDQIEAAQALVEQLDPKQCILKVGSEMFTLFGSVFVRRLVTLGFRVFLDLKFHDIPNTVSKACLAAAEMGVWMINVHASGGLVMMQEAAKSLSQYGDHKPLLIGVTVLTALNGVSLQTIGITEDFESHVLRLALLTKEAGLDGVVCSAFEVSAIKKACGQAFLTVTPGIRMASDSKNDQVRVATVEHAVQWGADYLVIGRPITQASDPMDVVHRILRQMY